MPVNITRMREENQKAIDAMDNSIQRLQALLDKGPPFSEELDIKAELRRAKKDKIHLQLVRGHLRAADTIVNPISQSVEARLDELSARLDAAILQDFTINATFTVVRKVLSAAKEISEIASQSIDA